MIFLDSKYSDYVIWGSPDYPGGKAYDASNADSIDGTPYKDVWMNDVNGFFQALIISAFGSMDVISGVPDTAHNSDKLRALYKIIENIFGRVPTTTAGPLEIDITKTRRYQIFYIGNIEENARIYLPDISSNAAVDVVEIEIFNTSSQNLKVIIYPESEFLNLTPGGWVKIRPYNITPASSKWGHSFHYVDSIVPGAPVKYDSGGKLKSERPVTEQDVLRLGDKDIYVQAIDFTPLYQLIYSNMARIDALEKAAANNIFENPFIISFPDLNGINLITGTWNKPYGKLECSYIGGGISIMFTNLNSIEHISGIWNMQQSRLEC